MPTLVQIKRSSANATPASLTQGELAYSYSSNTLFIGLPNGSSINIGGQSYTSLLDQATAANSASTLVRRYANGSAQFQQLDIQVSPTSSSHVATKQYVDSAITSNVSLDTLTDVIVTGVAAAQNNRLLIGQANGQYITTDVTGNVAVSNTGVFTVGTNQITNAMLAGSITNDKLQNNSVTVTAGAGITGGGSVALGSTITLDVRTGDGMSNTADYINVDSTVVRTDRAQTLNGASYTFSNTVTFNSGINVTGNIVLNGNTTYINVATLNVSDPLIYLAANNSTSDTVDIGFMGAKNTSGVYSHTGFVRSASQNAWYLFDGLAEEGHVNNVVDIANTFYALLRANLEAKSLVVTGAGAVANINTNLLVGGDLTISGGDLIATTATKNVFNITTTTVNFGGAATTINMGAAAGTVTVAGDLSVSGGDITSTATANLLNTSATTINFGRVANTITIGNTTGSVTVQGDLTVSGGDITSTATANLLNTTTTTLNLGGAATTLSMGAAAGTVTVAGDLTVSGGDITSTATANLLNATTTTLNLGGAATTLNMGAAAGTVTVAGDLTVSGGDIVSTATANIANVTTTTLNLGGAATTVRIGAAGANTTVRSNLIATELSSANSFISSRTAVVPPNLANTNGERVRLYDWNTSGRPNYAIGVESGNIWMGIDSSANTEGFKWYGNTSQAMRVSGNGVLEVANTIITSNIFAASLTLSTPLAVGSGGTGRSSFTANGVVYASTTSSLALATGTEGQVLQISSGVPAFAMLDGGSF